MAKKLIPRTLFYCWFGGNEKPYLVQRCIQSWKDHMPRWDIVEINESNFPIDEFPFAKEAIRRKRYAFATDIARLWCLKEFGGVYVDSDVFVVKPLDKFLENRAFTGHETDDLWVTAVMGSVANHEWIEYLLSYYKDREYDENTNTRIITQYSRKILERENKFGYRWLKGDVCIHPVHSFCSFDHRRLEVIPHDAAYAYHLFAGSWCRSDIQDDRLIKQRLRKLLDKDKNIMV